MSAKAKTLPRAGDMTQGSVARSLILFSLPTLLSNILNQLYNMADAVIVGKFVGANALAAVTSNSMVSSFLITLIIGIGAGSGVYISQLYGARKYEDIDRAFNTMFLLVIILGVFTALFASLTAPIFFRLVDTPSDIYADTVMYMQITALSAPGVAVYSMGSSALRSIGDAKAPLYFLIFTAICNVVLNIFFVVVLRMGVAGVAWATFIAQYLSGILVFFRASRTKICKVTINFKTLRIHKDCAMPMIKLGIPAALMNTITSIGSIITQRFFNAFGSDAIAAIGSVMKLDGFVMMPAQAISMSLAVFFGQNMAAKKHERLHKGTITGLSMGLIITVVISAIIYIFPDELLRIFTDSEAVISYGKEMIRFMAFFYWIMTFFNAFGGIMRGAGDTMFMMIVSIIGVVLRVPLTWLMAIYPEPQRFIGLFEAMQITNIIMCVIVTVYYFMGRWKKKVLVTIDD